MTQTQTQRTPSSVTPHSGLQDTRPQHVEERILIFAPLGRDGNLMDHALKQGRIPALLCENPVILHQQVTLGAGALVLTTEAVEEMSFAALSTLLRRQPAWSDLPLILLVSANSPALVEDNIYALGNVTFLERPVRLPNLLAAVRAALRARKRQYEVRDLLVEATRQQAEIQELNARLKQSMTETHHRVKNNLQIIAAMIDMQVMEGGQQLPASEFVRLGSQVRTLAVIHDLLTTQAKVDGMAHSLSSRAVLEQLLPLLQIGAADRHLCLTLDEVRLTARQATSLALITNELVSNALKHGVGNVEVTFQLMAQSAVLEVCDDGHGFPPDFDPGHTGTTGLELVENLSRWDLQGIPCYENRAQGGAHVSIAIPRASLPDPE